MNERIKQLAVAAAPANSSIPHSEWNIPKEFIEKFAELIIQECAEQVKNMRVNDYGISGAEIIREHFGVQE